MTRLITGLQPVREAIRVHGQKLERVLVEKGGGPQIEAVARFARLCALPAGCRIVRTERAHLIEARGAVVRAISAEAALRFRHLDMRLGQLVEEARRDGRGPRTMNAAVRYKVRTSQTSYA